MIHPLFTADDFLAVAVRTNNVVTQQCLLNAFLELDQPVNSVKLTHYLVYCSAVRVPSLYQANQL